MYINISLISEMYNIFNIYFFYIYSLLVYYILSYTTSINQSYIFYLKESN